MIAKTETMQTSRLLLKSNFWLSMPTITSANKLFKKCANIGTIILSVFKYRIATHIAKTNAEIILPYEWSIANNREEIKIANTVGRIIFSLFKITPLKINSSDNGEIRTVAKKLQTSELARYSEDKWNLTKEDKSGNRFKIKFERYNIPYEKKMFRTTTIRIYLNKSLEKTSKISLLISENEFLNLNMK